MFKLFNKAQPKTNMSSDDIADALNLLGNFVHHMYIEEWQATLEEANAPGETHAHAVMMAITNLTHLYLMDQIELIDRDDSVGLGMPSIVKEEIENNFNEIINSITNPEVLH